VEDRKGPAEVPEVTKGGPWGGQGIAAGLGCKQ
jgi:hypothetical protein